MRQVILKEHIIYPRNNKYCGTCPNIYSSCIKNEDKIVVVMTCDLYYDNNTNKDMILFNDSEGYLRCEQCIKDVQRYKMIKG